MCHLASDIDKCQYLCVSISGKPLPVLDQTLECCSPLATEPMGEETATRVASLLKALADPVRLRLMSLVLSHEGGEACVCDLNEAFDLSQPTISHHLKVLNASGLLDREKRGVWVYYRARPEALSAIATLFGDAVPA
jgi:ArsR family transcriptional regulator